MPVSFGFDRRQFGALLFRCATEQVDRAAGGALKGLQNQTRPGFRLTMGYTMRAKQRQVYLGEP
jgi:hypothetical protein